LARRLVLSSGFTVIDGQQRRLHDRAVAQGFADLDGYLTARCQQASLAQLASELGITTVVARRLLDHAGLTPPPRRATSARQRRRSTDQRLAARAAQLGFASLGAYLADRARTRGWPSSQIASELGVHAATVGDRLDSTGCHASGRPSGPLRRPSWCRRTAIATSLACSRRKHSEHHGGAGTS
jgi:hypothetical protein